MQPIEVSAKKVDDAIKEGLKILGTTLDKVEYKILDRGGFFKKARISIAVLEDENQAKKQPATKYEAKHEIVLEERKPIIENAPIRQEKTAEESFKQPRQLPKESSAPQKQQQSKPIAKSEPQTASRPQKPANQHKHSSGESKPPRAASQKPQHHEEEKNFETKKRARTEIISDEAVQRAVSFTTELISLMGFEAKIKTDIIEGDLIIDLISDNGVLIGYRGETLDAIEYLVSIQTNKDNDEYINIVVDSCGYRKKREKMLIAMAENSANRCIKTGRKVIMEPMNRSSRKIVHSALSNYDNIFSKSEGSDPNRHIVIYFKREKSN